MKKVVIIGATSAIAEAMGRQFSDQKNELFLIGRQEAHLKILSEDFSARSQKPCQYYIFEALQSAQFLQCLYAALDALASIDILVIAHGTLPDQKKCERNYQVAIEEFTVNATSYIGLLTVFSAYFEKQGQGNIIAFSSCAADRGRPSNYLYGSAKAAITTFCAGLHLSLQDKGVGVLIVKPGFVDTPMTKEFKKGLLWAKPESVSKKIIAAMINRKNVIYVPGFWRYIMVLIRLLPGMIVKRL